MRDAVGFEGARGIENYFVDFAHGVNGIVWRFVMMRRIEALRNGENIVELVTVEIPIANKFFGELLEVGLNFRNGGTEDGEVARHASGLAIFAEHQPVGMLLDHVGDDEFAAAVAVVAVFHADGEPPELHLDALLVKGVDHFAHGIARESVGARKPIAVIVVPAVVERGPVDAEVF